APGPPPGPPPRQPVQSRAPVRPDEHPVAAPSPGSQLASVDEKGFKAAHASPSVRRFARQLGVDLSRVQGSGRKERILQSDVEQFVSGVMRRGGGEAAPATGGGLPRMPEIDFSRFGEIEVRDLPRIRRLSAQNVHRSWLVIPHVTQHDAADITELEAFRKEENRHLETR